MKLVASALGLISPFSLVLSQYAPNGFYGVPETEEVHVRTKRGYNNNAKRGVITPPANVPGFSGTFYKGNDPYFSKQWYLNNTDGLDLNVRDAWRDGATGKGVKIAILDDGIDYLHPDLRDSYNADLSWDYSSNDPYPYPRWTDNGYNSHGTRCAGEIVSKADNGVCGVGVAPGAEIVGVRMLDQSFMTDSIEAKSMSHRFDQIDIYSASWGPTDDGKTVDGPRRKTLEAMAMGVTKGRGGKGSIYIWASGDGGANDDCNCDGYASSIWTISINAVGIDGSTAVYDESCASTLATTFSNSKDPSVDGISTTDLYGGCTTKHSGTSAAAPEAAGVVALALGVNPALTWRDVQHLVVLTSKRRVLHDSLHLWKRNGVGLEFNHLFGFGILDAGSMVHAAKAWKNVPTRYFCVGADFGDESFSPSDRFQTSDDDSYIFDFKTDACKGTDNEVNFLERAQLVLSIKSSRRGDLQINGTSPMGTETMVLNHRPNDDDSTDGFMSWPFTTSQLWGENPRGKWRISVRLNPNGEFGEQIGMLTNARLILYGTKEPPYTKEVLPPNVSDELAFVKRAEDESEKNNNKST